MLRGATSFLDWAIWYGPWFHLMVTPDKVRVKVYWVSSSTFQFSPETISGKWRLRTSSPGPHAGRPSLWSPEFDKTLWFSSETLSLCMNERIWAEIILLNRNPPRFKLLMGRSHVLQHTFQLVYTWVQHDCINYYKIYLKYYILDDAASFILTFPRKQYSRIAFRTFT